MDTTSSPASRKHIYALIVNESPVGRNSLKSSLEMINSMKLHEARSLSSPLLNAPRDKIRTIATSEASSGDEALKIIHDNPVDLVFAYHVLPDMSGLELLSQIRHEQRTALLPFILVTEVTDRTEFINSIELGASDYLLMPFS